MKLQLSISPCPNDTFMFDAMVNGRIDTEGLEFDVYFADIEELNRDLIGEKKPDISKVSYASVPQILDSYRICTSGSALGSGNGPLLVTADENADLSDFEMRVAVPGENTTANLLMERLFPHLADKRFYLFSDIMDIVERGECDAGVLIHEGRFTYRRRGLFLLADLGLEWERRTGLPLPLGAIVVSRKLPLPVQKKVNRVLRRSIEYAFAHPEDSSGFVKSHAQEMDRDVVLSHIELFVNEYSVDLGERGRRAIGRLLGIPEAGAFAE